MGTLVEVNIQADCGEQKLLEACNAMFDVINQIQTLMSFHDPNSELSHINENAFNKPQPVSTMTKQVLEMAQTIFVNSSGAFDLTVASKLVEDGMLPDRDQNHEPVLGQSHLHLNDNKVSFSAPIMLDLGGIAKGFAVDIAAQTLIDRLSGMMIQASINAGGDMWVYDCQNYAVMIPNHNKKLTDQTMYKNYLATSSGYYLEGKSAIYQVDTGRPVKLENTVSVFADSCMIADGLTKVAAILPLSHNIFSTFDVLVIKT